MKKYFTFSNILFLVCFIISCVIAFFIGKQSVWLVWCSTILGMLASKCASEGSWLTFLFDILSYVLYIGICFSQKNFGEMFLALIIILTHTYGMMEWKNHQKNNIVSINNINRKELSLALYVGIFSFLIYICVLSKMGSNLIFLNAFNTIVFLLGNYFSYRRCILQFYFWNLYEIGYILIWLLVAINGEITAIIFLMGAICELIYNFIGIFKWQKLIQNKQTQIKINCYIYKA